jgi:hypothetical protein
MCPSKKLQGRVAQLVEQGIENPCVGGSSPPRATFLSSIAIAACLALNVGCADPCIRTCSSAANAVGDCVDDWSLDWGDLGANGQTQFRDSCEQSWARSAAALESRELEQALLQCETVNDEINELTCDELLVLYAP